MIISDLVVLGRGCPDKMRDGRVTVCTAGHSQSLGFVRVYPTRIGSPLRQWNIVEVPVDRDPRDTRTESWKIEGSKQEWDRLSEKVQVSGYIKKLSDRRNLVANLVDGCVKDVNDVHRSLGIVEPAELEPYIAEKKDYDKEIQATLFGGPPILTKGNYPIEPRIRFRCSGCRQASPHDMQVIEWGFYEWFRKHPENPEQVWTNARLKDPGYNIYLFVGNQFRYRTAYIIIGVLRVKKGTIAAPLHPLRRLPPDA